MTYHSGLILLIGMAVAGMVQSYVIRRLRVFSYVSPRAWLRSFHCVMCQKFALTAMVFWVMLSHIASLCGKAVFLVGFMFAYLLSLPLSYRFWSRSL